MCIVLGLDLFDYGGSGAGPSVRGGLTDGEIYGKLVCDGGGELFNNYFFCRDDDYY